GVVSALAASEHVIATRGDGSAELGPQDRVNLRPKKVDGVAFDISSTAATETYELAGVSAASIAGALAAQINGLNWQNAGALIPLQASASGSTLRITAVRPGYDGNMLTMYATAKNDRLKTQSAVASFQGGSSDATWRVTLNFSSLGVPQIRLMWLTLAPRLAKGAAFESTEWQAAFTNWSLTGPEDMRRLQVAGHGSVRIEEDDSWCSYTGNWSVESGFYSDGYAKRASAPGDTVTVNYSCASIHDLYIGTSLYTDRGIVGVKLDGGSETDLNCYLQNEPAVITRRKIRSAVPAGEHSVTIRLKSGQFFYFDFLEAVVASDVPDALAPRTNLSPALDYSTDHTYKVPPARLMWMFDKLGFAGPMNEYIGVFWWNQRRRVDAVIPSATVTFAGEFLPQDQVFINIGGQPVGKTVFPNETASTIAKHFEYFINANYVGVWAAAVDGTLTVTVRSPQPSYSYSFAASKESTQNSAGTVDVAGSLQGGQPGRWVVDPDQIPALNRGAREWHSDFFRQCQARGREIVLAASMELVNPPQGFAAVFPDGQPVATSVGFASLNSTHCTFNTPMRAYQQSVYKTVADLMADAGLTPNLQFGEFLWWFFTNKTADNPSGGMAFYDEETKTAALAALGRPLHV
ncbi:MAG: non-contractile tail sheath protein, partial [Bryobacteraceae bacterium]